MGDVLEFDMGNASRGRPPPRIASRLAAGWRSSGAKSTDGPLSARPPSGRADSKASEPAIPAKKHGSVATDSFRRRGSALLGRGSSDDEAAAKPMIRRAPGSPPGHRRAGIEPDRRGSPNFGASDAEVNKFRLGQKIEGRYHGKGRWYKGRIIGVNAGGTYDVRYEDGDEDLGLEASAIKVVEANGSIVRDHIPARGSTTVSAQESNHRSEGLGRSPRIGSYVDARVPGSSRWQHATVVGKNRDGTLDVRFRDGSEEKYIDSSLVREREDSEGGRGQKEERKKAEEFLVGDSIEARYHGKSKWFKGIIRRVNSNNTYDIRYSDGDQEAGVDSSLIRALVGDSGSSGSGARGASNSEYPPFRGGGNYFAGDKIEARFGGRAQWFRATVERENRNGTFHLIYVDGDEERSVEQSFMRKIDGGGGDRSGSTSPGRRVISGVGSDRDIATHPGFRQGDKVEARYKRGRKWYVGIIRAVSRDGTYAIRYEDGDTEDGVDPGLVRGVGVGSTESLASTAGAKKGKEGNFLEGEKVEARFEGRSRWFKATVQRRNREGTYHLLYIDGDEERAVEKDMIRRIEESDEQDAKFSTRRPSSHSVADLNSDTAATRRKFRIGDEIEGRYKRGHKWYPGTVQTANRDGTYDIRYRDGDTERNVQSSLMRGKVDASMDSSNWSEGAAKGVSFSRGDKVKARFGGRSRWLKATVERKNRDGTYHLLYEDGEEEKAVDRGLIHRVGEKVESTDRRATSGSKSPDYRAKGETDFESDLKKHLVGDGIEARYKRGRKWYPGTIRAVNRNGTYSIRYKDGDEESDVEAALVREPGKASINLSALSIDGGDFAEGGRVEARFGGGSRWFKATVERKNRDGTYFLVYADGDEEQAVEKILIRGIGGPEISKTLNTTGGSALASRIETNLNTPRKDILRVGDDIEAKYKKGHKWYPGVVRAVNRGGTYDIRYKDGDKEYDVEENFVRAMSADPLASEVNRKRGSDEYAEDDEVEARFGGRSRWLKAKIARVCRDGTYHLVYVDGDEERSVPKSLIRRIEGDAAKERKNSSSARSENTGGRIHQINDEIEARYKKGHKWYPGVIQAISRDGTYDIRYLDGDTERKVEPALIRGKERGGDISLTYSTDGDFLEGAKVEARFGGRSRWFTATVERRHRDGTYHLRYVDGNEEKVVEKHMMRQIETGSSSMISNRRPGQRGVSGFDYEPDYPTVKGYRVGDSVKARYKRGSKWFPGVVRTVNRDGTYDIRYKDGDSEQNVDSRLIRSIGMSSTNSLSTSNTNAEDITGRHNSDFFVGDKVEARFGGRSRWFKATVELKNRDGTYHLLYADGDEERNVEKNLIRRVDNTDDGRPTSGSPGRRVVSGEGTDNEKELVAGMKLREGDEIEARYKRGRKWFPGVISSTNRDGTYDIRYNDGDKERFVDCGFIRGKGNGSVDSFASGVDGIATTHFATRDEVEARFGGGSRWFKATVKRKNRSGTYHLLYADGDEETSVEKKMIRGLKDAGDFERSNKREDSKPDPRRTSSAESLTSDIAGNYHVGDNVEARIGGRSRWFRATVEQENSNGTYRLLYADGKKERMVESNLIRNLVRSSEAKGIEKPMVESLRIGDDIEARYKRARKWYAGVIWAINPNGTYNIRYKDGDSEREVEAAFVRQIGVTNKADCFEEKKEGELSIGDKVEARFNGRSRWFKATIERKHRDNTFDLLYADGDEENHVERSLIRHIDESRQELQGIRGVARKVLSGGGSGIDADRGETKVGYREGRGLSDKEALPRAGDKVEARFRGGPRWLPGRVSHVHLNGSYSISFADGNSERSVLASHVRPKIKRATTSSSGSDRGRDRENNNYHRVLIAEGDVVEARFRGRSNWHKGEVNIIHSDGTYDIHYKDGETEERVQPRLVRLPQSTDGRRRVSSRERQRASENSSDTEGNRGQKRGRSRRMSPKPHEPTGEDAERAATKVRRALRNAGKNVEDFTRKLERVRRGSGGSGIDKKTLETSLEGIGVNISSLEVRALSSYCMDVQNNDVIDLLTFASLVHGGKVNGKHGRSTDTPPLSNSHRRGRQSETSASGGSTGSDGAAAARRRSREPRRRGGSTLSGSENSSSDAGRGRSRSSCRASRSGTEVVDINAKLKRRSSSERRRNKSARAVTNTTSESEGGDNTSFEVQPRRGLMGKRSLNAIKKLGVSALDGSLRREFESLSGSRDRELSTTNLKRLLRRLRVTLEEKPLGEIAAILDLEDVGSFFFEGLLEVVLSTAEGEKAAKIHAAIQKQLFAPSSQRGKRRGSKEAKAASAAVSKTLTKMDHPKGSRLLLSGDLREILKKAGANISSAAAQVLSERLDPEGRGKIDRDAFVMWLTSGFDPLQAESRTSGQLGLLKPKGFTPEYFFREFDVDREGVVTKGNFVLALQHLGLVLTHGQATSLAAKHHTDYRRFLTKIGDQRGSSEGGASEGSNSGSAGRFQCRNRTTRPGRQRTGRGANSGGLSDDSDHLLTSGSSDREGDTEGEGLLLGKRVRLALCHAFERTCNSTGGVREIFYSAGSSGKKKGGDGSDRDGLVGWEQTRRFIRRLKLDVSDEDRSVLLNTLIGLNGDGRGKGERGVSFEKEGRRKYDARRDKGGSETGGEGGDGGTTSRVLYRDFLELVLAEQESKEISEIHGRMAKDLAKTADAKRLCPYGLTVKALSKHDDDGFGFVKASDFKRRLEHMGVGGLSSAEKSLLVRRFDPAEKGMVNYELFSAWLSSGLDPDRLTTKMGRLLGQLTGSASGSGEGKEGLPRGGRKKRKGGIRGVFENIDQDAEGTICQHDMKVVLRKTLGLPLTEGDLRALFSRLDKGRNGMLDYEELLVLASKRKRGRDSENEHERGGILSKIKKKQGSVLIKGASAKGSKRRGRDNDSGGEADTDNTTDLEREEESSGDDGDDSDGEKGDKRRRSMDENKNKRKKGDDKNRQEGGRRRKGSPSKKARGLGNDLMRLRLSILYQSAATARGHENEEGEIDPVDAVDWTVMFEGKDRAGTGKATTDDLHAVFKEGGVQLSEGEISLLLSVFSASNVDNEDGAGSEGDDEEGESKSSRVPLVDYDAFVRWLSECGGLDDSLLGKVQRHLKARLSKVMDLRALFTEMCDVSSSSSSSSKRHSDKRSSDRSVRKEQLSGSHLARGLKHAGLPLDRSVIDQLVAAFSTGGGKGTRLSYADFHRMVHCKGLANGGSAAIKSGGQGGFAGRQGTLDEQIRSTLLEAVERAFAFYDEDNSNSIDAAEVVNILRALGHDPTRGEARTLLRKADVDRNGVVQYEDFQESVMPFLLERAQTKRLTEGEMRAIFDEIDTNHSGAIKREEFAYLFCGKMQLLSQEEAEALLSVLDRHQSGQVSWEEFVRLFELIGDSEGDGGIAALNPCLKEVVTVALRKLQMGVMPNVEEQLSLFLGMPSTCRKSVLSPLDHIKELSLQWVLMPKLDSRGCIQLQDMSVKVTTEVAEVEVTKAPPNAQGQVLVKTVNLADREKANKNKKPPVRSLAATLGFGKRDTSPPPAVTELRGTKTRRRSSILGMGLIETTTTVMKRAELQEVGASTEEGKRGRRVRENDSSGVMQVELSVKHAYGIPVARDSRTQDIRQRGMRACLFYDAGSEVDRDTGEKSSSEYGEHFLCNTYKTLAIQHPQKEEQWLFPDSSEGERKFLVRTDFGSDSRQEHRSHRNSRSQRTGDDHPSPSSPENRENLFLLVELTCTVQTLKDGTLGTDTDDYGELGGVQRGNGGGGNNEVRGPLKNFRAGSSAVGGRGSRGRKKGGGGRRTDSDYSDEESSRDDDSDGAEEDHAGEGDSDTASASDESTARGRKGRTDKKRRKRNNNNNGRGRGNKRKTNDDDDDESTEYTTASSSDRTSSNKNHGKGRGLFRRGSGNNENKNKRGRNRSGRGSNTRQKQKSRSVPPPRRVNGGRRGVSRGRRGSQSEGPQGRSRDRNRNDSNSSNSDVDSQNWSDRNCSGNRGSSGRRGGDRKAKNESGERGERRGWRGAWRLGGGGGGRDKKQRRGNRRKDTGTVEHEEERDGVVEVEMSCGWVLIPFLDLAETQEVTKVRYKLLGGTPFAKTDINEDEVMSRRYGWRAVLKAMKIAGKHKESEVEIKILPVNTLSKVKQEDIFRLPRNVVLSDTFVSLVRYYREYAANSLAKRSARGMGNAGFGAASASSEPVLALFPRLAADPALMMALKNQWDAEVRKTHVDSKLGATLAAGLAGVGLGSGVGGGLAGLPGGARGANLLKAFEKAVLRLWPAFCHIDAQRCRAVTGRVGAESYEELEGRCLRVRQILNSTDSFHSDTPTNVSNGKEGTNGQRGAGSLFSSTSDEGGVMVAFTLKEVAFDVA